MSLREGQLRALEQHGRRGERAAALARNPNRFLSSVQIGVTVAGFFSAAYGASTLAPNFSPTLRHWGLSAGTADVVALVATTLVISYLSLVLGELVPKRIALQSATGVALVTAPPLDRFARLVRPVICCSRCPRTLWCGSSAAIPDVRGRDHPRGTARAGDRAQRGRRGGAPGAHGGVRRGPAIARRGDAPAHRRGLPRRRHPGAAGSRRRAGTRPQPLPGVRGDPRRRRRFRAPTGPVARARRRGADRGRPGPATAASARSNRRSPPSP